MLWLHRALPSATLDKITYSIVLGNHRQMGVGVKFWGLGGVGGQFEIFYFRPRILNARQNAKTNKDTAPMIEIIAPSLPPMENPATNTAIGMINRSGELVLIREDITRSVPPILQSPIHDRSAQLALLT